MSLIFPKPNPLNGGVLRDELADAGFDAAVFDTGTGTVEIVGVRSKDREAVQAVVAAHRPDPNAEFITPVAAAVSWQQMRSVLRGAPSGALSRPGREDSE